MKQQQEERLKAVIVDDEDLARSIVREYLGGFHDIDIVADCANGFEAVKAIPELNPDILFLDIQMPKLNGFEVLELVQHQPAVIFVTAFDQYALKAFEVHAVDYLLKPFTRDRFDMALALAREQLRRRKSQPLAEVIAAARKKDIPLERVLVRDGSKVHVIPVEKIDYIEAQNDYIAIKTEGKTHLKQQRLAELENLLEPRRFVRIHRSFILNIERLARIELYAKDSRVAILKDGTKLQVSRAGFDKLKELL